MQTHKLIRPLIVAVGLVGFSRANGQASVLGNAGGPGDHLGWDNTNAFPLEVRHDGNQPIDWYTEMIQRMSLRPNETFDIGPFLNQNKDGGLLLGGDVTPFLATGLRPFSALHLIEPNTVNTQVWGYRPWMRNGVTFTGNYDLGYIGHKYGTDQNGDIVDDESDMVIHWSNDNGGEWGPDRLTFRFTTPYNPLHTTGSSTVEGLEAMRITPIDANNANVGIGDFVAGGGEPTERLDVLTGNVRVRDLPANGPSTSNNYVTVNMATGVLENRPLPVDPGACEWTMSNTAPNNVITAVGAPDANCPDAAEHVGIGTTLPTSKLDVVHNESNGTMPGGVNVVFTPDATDPAHGVNVNVSAASGSAPGTINGVLVTSANSTFDNWAVEATAQQVNTSNTNGVYGGHFTADIDGSSTVAKSYGVYGQSIEEASSSVAQAVGVYGRALYNKVNARGVVGWAESTPSAGNVAYGVHGSAKGAATNYGLYGIGNQTGAINYGAWGRATGGSSSNNYGVRGDASGATNNFSIWASNPGSGATDWSGYFTGRVTIVSDLYHNTTLHFSDAALKTDVEDLTSVRERLEGLRPRSYRFTQQAQARMGSSPDLQLGFIAQEVEQVLPELVSPTTLAAIQDTTGQEIWPAQDVKAVNYVAIIPLLVAGYQEQQSTIDELQNRLGEMQDLLAACCANPDRALQQPGGDTGIPAFAGMTPGGEKLRIQPNPFNERTTVFYKLDNGGRTQLMANSADGKELRVLHEATLEKGDYQYEWNTTALAPGMYYVTLLVDGQLVVKKAVKVDR